MPNPKNPELYALRLTDPAAFHQKLIDLLLVEPAVGPVSEKLGIHRTTLFRWLDDTGELGREGSIETLVFERTGVKLRPGAGRRARPAKKEEETAAPDGAADSRSPCR